MGVSHLIDSPTLATYTCPPSRIMKPPRIGALLLGFIPFIGACFTVPLWDRVFPLVLGLPFNLFWLITWIPLTSLCLWGAYRVQTKVKDQELSR